MISIYGSWEKNISLINTSNLFSHRKENFKLPYKFLLFDLDHTLLDFDAALTAKAPDLWSAEIDQLIFKGSSVIEEVVFFHKSTKTLIVTDLIENFEPEKIASPIRRKFYRLARVTAPDGQTPIDYRMTFLGRQREAKVSFSRMLNWKPDKIILAHGLCFF